MTKFEYKVFRCKVQWEGAWYFLSVMTGRDKDTDWVDANEIGSEGWDFVSFVPEGQEYISGTFSESELRFVKLALFKRTME